MSDTDYFEDPELVRLQQVRKRADVTQGRLDFYFVVTLVYGINYHPQI